MQRGFLGRLSDAAAELTQMWMKYASVERGKELEIVNPNIERSFEAIELMFTLSCLTMCRGPVHAYQCELEESQMCEVVWNKLMRM